MIHCWSSYSRSPWVPSVDYRIDPKNSVGGISRYRLHRFRKWERPIWVTMQSWNENALSRNCAWSRVRQIHIRVLRLPSRRYRQYQNGAYLGTLQDEQNQSRYRVNSGKKWTTILDSYIEPFPFWEPLFQQRNMGGVRGSDSIRMIYSQ